MRNCSEPSAKVPAVASSFIGTVSRAGGSITSTASLSEPEGRRTWRRRRGRRGGGSTCRRVRWRSGMRIGILNATASLWGLNSMGIIRRRDFVFSFVGDGWLSREIRVSWRSRRPAFLVFVVMVSRGILQPMKARGSFSFLKTKFSFLVTAFDRPISPSDAQYLWRHGQLAIPM
jgi:hypothetical protein